ncbi:phosphotransferase [Nocardia australiensis]|uniref:phosphotransferase n=1 Tax=Nocardia australiensis TaxID=2887191 RepID=UPI001D1346CF|nr:aminoglycoside phosphotransferase family protein [Nocardia australiensis]
MSPSPADTTALRVLGEAAAISGVDSTGAELIRAGSNTIYRISDLVARIGKPGTADVAERELLISRWLNESGVPTVVAADIEAPLAVVEGRPVTWWRTLRGHRPSTPAELGTALRHLHALSPPTEFTLALHQPFAGLRQQINIADHIAVEDRAWLIAHHDELREQYAALEPSDHQTVIHGDAWQGNLIVPIDQPATFLDLERVSLGRSEWDLVQIAADYTDFERLSPVDYASFVASYGDDLTAHTIFRLFADIQELRWTIFALTRSKMSARAAAQVSLRIACLRGEVPRPWRWDAL